MRLELDLDPGDWDDYKGAPLAELKRVGVHAPTKPIGIRHFVRLGALVDGKPVVVLAAWQVWQAAHRALAEHLGEAAPEPEAAELPPVLAAIQEAVADHARRWDLDAGHEDGTDPDSWADLAKESRADATAAAINGELTWAHTLLEAVHGALATEDPGELSQALAGVAGTAAAWMEAIDGRTS